MKKTALSVMILTMLSKLFGFVREIALSYFYGASNISDAYLISTTIPMIIFSFVGTGITTGYIPMFSKIENDKGILEANKYTNNLLNILVVLCFFIFLLGLLFTEQIVKIFATGFEGDTLVLAVKFTKISLLGIYFTSFIYIFNGFLQVKGNFIIPTLVGFPLNFFIIVSIFLSSKTNILALSIGSVLATASQLFLVLPFAYKNGYKYNLIINVKDIHIKTMVRMAIPVIIGVSVNQINTLVDRTLASQIAIGGISALNYANRLNLFVQGIFVLSIVTVIYPMISKLAVENNIKGLKKSLSEAINSINLLVLPVTVGAMIFAEPVVKLLFGRGAFNTKAINMTSNALFFYSIGMVGFGLREILSRAFYSLQDIKTPMINASIAMIINIILNIILSKFLGIGGLALATSISAILCTMLLFISLRKKIGSFGMKQVTISFIKITISSILMGIVAKNFYNILINKFSFNLSLIVAVGIGSVIYFTLIYFMKIREMEDIIKAIKYRIKKSYSN